MEVQIAEFRVHTAALANAFSRGDIALVVRATGDASRVFNSIAAAMIGLKDEVIPADGLGNAMGSLAELVIRAVRMVVAVQVSDLRDVVRGPAAMHRARALFTGRFQNIDDVAAFVHGEFYRINDLWMRHRCGGEQGAATTRNRVIYLAAVGAAQRAVRAVGADPDLAHFLREGATCVDWPAVHRGCTQISAAVHINIDAGAMTRTADA
jgi:hypothetical protein